MRSSRAQKGHGQSVVEAMKSVVLGPSWAQAGVGAPEQMREIPMDRRTLLLGLLGGMAAAPTIIAAASSVEAAPLPETSPPTPEPLPNAASSSAVTEADLEGVKTDWSQRVRVTTRGRRRRPTVVVRTRGRRRRRF